MFVRVGLDTVYTTKRNDNLHHALFTMKRKRDIPYSDQRGYFVETFLAWTMLIRIFGVVSFM